MYVFYIYPYEQHIISCYESEIIILVFYLSFIKDKLIIEMNNILYITINLLI